MNMIPGTIGEWKAALASSREGGERGVCVQALKMLGAEMQSKHDGVWLDTGICMDRRYQEYRVKPTPRPWNAEDARRHVGFAYRYAKHHPMFIVRDAVCEPMHDWSNAEYATPIPGIDPSTWNWQKCEVVE